MQHAHRQSAHRQSAHGAETAAPQWRAQAMVAHADLFAAPPYGDLYASADTTAFQHPIWMQAFARYVAPDRGATVHLVTVADSAGRWLAALPLITRSFSGATLLEATDLGVSDYCAPLIDRSLSKDPAAVTALAQSMAAVLPAHDIVRFRNLRPEHVPFFEALAGRSAEPAGYSAHATALAPTRQDWRARAPRRP